MAVKLGCRYTKAGWPLEEPDCPSAINSKTKLGCYRHKLKYTANLNSFRVGEYFLLFEGEIFFLFDNQVV